MVTKDGETGLPTVYQTLDERCAACVINGGPEERCVGESWDVAIGSKIGRPCPRVELPAEMLAEAELLAWLIHDDKRPLADARFWTLVQTWGLSAAEADQLLARVSYVLSDSAVVSILHPEPSRDPDA